MANVNEDSSLQKKLPTTAKDVKNEEVKTKIKVHHLSQSSNAQQTSALVDTMR
jgi:hypothetical protein